MAPPPGKDSISNPTHSSSFLALPPELKIQIVKILDVSDIAHLRLMSRDWAEVGAPELFKHGFSLRPHRDDMARLQSVCKHPEIAKGIKHLDIYMGDMSKQQFADAVSRQRYLSKKDFKALSKVFDKVFSDPISKHCNKSMLEQAFSQLPNLTSITATSSRFPFSTFPEPAPRKNPSSLLAGPFHEVWDTLEDEFDQYERTNFFDKEVSVERYSSILLASLKLQTPLQVLVLDSLPIDCFIHPPENSSHYSDVEWFPDTPPARVTVDTTKVEEMTKAVADVRDLQIGLIGSGSKDNEYSNPFLGRVLGEFIGSMQHLRSLQVEFLVDDSISPDFAVAWERGFYKNYFPHIEDLRMTRLDSHEKMVTPFIIKHSSTLKRLHLGFDAVWLDLDAEMEADEARSWKDVFTEYKERLPNLQIFEYLEDSSDPQRIYDDNWRPIPIAKNKRVPNAKLLELFVLGKCPWPMASDNPRGWRGWKPKFMGSHLDFMNLSPGELDSLLGGDWETESDSGSSEEDEMDLDDSDDFDSDSDSDSDESFGPGHTNDMDGIWIDI
jgi:hypothetical protein